MVFEYSFSIVSQRGAIALLGHKPNPRVASRFVLLVLSILILLGFIGTSEASIYRFMFIESQVNVGSPIVVLQNGTAGTSLIHNNYTSAKVSVLGYGYDLVDNNDTDVDSSADKGTHSNFTAQQYADTFYDTLSEEDTGGAPSYATIVYVGASVSAQNNPTSGTFSFSGVSPEAGDFVLCWWYTRASTKTFTKPSEVTQLYEVADSAYGRLFIGYRIYQSGDSSYAWTSSSVSQASTVYGTSTYRNVNQTNPIDSDSGTPNGWSNVEDPDSPGVNVVTSGACVIPLFGKNNDYSSIIQPSNYNTGGSAATAAGNDASSGVAYRVVTSTGAEDPSAWNLTGGAADDDGYVWTGALKPNLVTSANYELDLEVQWTNVDYDETHEELCIRTGSFSGSEDLMVYVWNISASDWQFLYNLTTSSWNNVSVTDWLNNENFTVRFLGGTETSDASQNYWNIEATLLHIWTEPDHNYDYVLRVNNTDTRPWQIRLKKYYDSSIGRLQNCTIYFHNATDGTSSQLVIENGLFIDETGTWYDLADEETIYIAMTAEANCTGTSSVNAYLEIRVPATTTYRQYAVTFEIT